MEKEKKIRNIRADRTGKMMRIGIATDFGWFELKRKLVQALNAVGYELTDIGDYELVSGENYPDFVIPLAKAVSDGSDKQNHTNRVNSTVACAEVNKIPGVCAAIITKPYAVDEDLYIRCLGGQIKGYALSRKKVMTFLNADCSNIIPSNQRLAKVRMLEEV